MNRRRGRFRRWPDFDDLLRFMVTPQFALLYVVAWSAFIWWWRA